MVLSVAGRLGFGGQLCNFGGSFFSATQQVVAHAFGGMGFHGTYKRTQRVPFFLPRVVQAKTRPTAVVSNCD